MNRSELISAVLECCREYEGVDSMTGGMFKKRKRIALTISSSKIFNYLRSLELLSEDGNLRITNNGRLLMCICMDSMEIIYQLQN